MKNIKNALLYKSPIIGEYFNNINFINKIKKIALSDVTVLITGETGVGKELIANKIVEYSKRQNNCFFSVNCGGLTETLLETQLYGYIKGSFTGADADKMGLSVISHMVLFC